MATRITVDTGQAANSMQAMRQAISANTNAWKAIKNQPFCDRILSSTGEWIKMMIDTHTEIYDLLREYGRTWVTVTFKDGTSKKIFFLDVDDEYQEDDHLRAVNPGPDRHGCT